MQILKEERIHSQIGSYTFSPTVILSCEGFLFTPPGSFHSEKNALRSFAWPDDGIIVHTPRLAGQEALKRPWRLLAAAMGGARAEQQRSQDIVVRRRGEPRRIASRLTKQACTCGLMTRDPRLKPLMAHACIRPVRRGLRLSTQSQGRVQAARVQAETAWAWRR